ncbi:hypothetical protein K6T82_02945 [Flavobacterium sp. 17A]|uniref:YcxB-like protein n=1 Tax=Flavobacterium potami TaxID=2872310 RepID=A0A9X1H7P4_9FLAO|nr:hypothetical protein [Flavobacterium potami]MBZ4033705.1 hypothetical protein [Flavobacterium potami]
MKKSTKNYVVKKLKWPLGFFYFYSGNFVILSMPCVLIYLGTTNYEKDGAFLILTGFVFLIVLILRMEMERRFKELTLVKDYSTDEIGKLLQKNKWILSDQGDGILEFYTGSTLFSWGQKVTIVKVSKDKILINTLPNGRALFTFFKEILNYKIIKKILEE